MGSKGRWLSTRRSCKGQLWVDFLHAEAEAGIPREDGTKCQEMNLFLPWSISLFSLRFTPMKKLTSSPVVPAQVFVF